MTRQDFLVQLQDMLQSDSALEGDTILSNMEEWDSLAFMVLITFFDKKLGKRITFADLKPCRTVNDVIALSGEAIS